MPAEERKLATVLFADLVGSTELAGDQDPERVRALLDRFYDSMAAEIDRVDGTVEKFVGDAVMAAFGAPAAHEDDAERALHVALAMHRRLDELFGDALALRIGVNTGEVVVGAAREGSSFVTGDTVNVCARLEQAAARGETLVGERTVAAARGAFEFGPPRAVEAKGKPQPVACRSLLRALSLMRPRGVGGLEPVFVGRENELGALCAQYAAAVDDRHPHTVTVVGEAGVGKTRLIRELWQWLSEQAPQPVLRAGRCLPYGEGITYWPLAEVLREQFAILESDPTPAVAARFADREGLAYTLGLAPPPDVHPLTARERIHNAWVDLLQRLAEEQPTVLLIEDLHWAEAELCSLLQTVAARVAGPLLVVVTARPEVHDLHPDWGGETVRLEALQHANAEELVTAHLGGDCPAPIRNLIAERAEGNPFFVEELIAVLADRGVIGRRNGGWSFGELPEGFSIPDTVRAVLAARIDLLPAVEKSALQAGAVIGRTFWAGPVRELVQTAPDFELLEEREFVLRRAGSSMPGELEYAIKHALTREVAYDSILKAKRAPLHAAFAGWLERTAEGEDERASLLAHHYAEAVRGDHLDLAWAGREDEAEQLRVKAVAWSTRAAELAIARYEIDEGLALLGRAVDLEPDADAQARLWYAIGHAHALKFDGEGFWAAMEKALELGGPSADVQSELVFQSVRRYGMWTREPDPALIEAWIGRALELAEPGSRNRAKALYAESFWNDDEASARELYAIAEKLDDVQLRSHGLKAIANAAWGVGDLPGACHWTDRNLELLGELKDPDDSTRLLLDAVIVYLNAGALDRAANAARLSAELAAGLTPHHRLHGAANVAAVRAFAGRWDEVSRGFPVVERTVDANLAARTPCPQNVSTLLHGAVASVYQGDVRESERLEGKADEIGMKGYAMWFEPPRLRLALARGDLGTLERLVGSSPQYRRGLQAPFMPVWSAALLDACVALGDRDRIEAEAPKWAEPGTYAEPFAVRALGIAREDGDLVERALKRFEALQLDWHAGQTGAIAGARFTC